MSLARTLFDKIWDLHLIHTRDDGEQLLFVDRNLIHEGPFYAFDALRREGRALRNPSQTFAFPDHYVPTVNRERGVDGIADPEMRRMVEQLARNAAESGIHHFGIDDARQGIMHVAAPELGVIHPGMVITGSDSHTSTHGAFGALAMGVGASQIKHVMATQTLWQPGKPRAMRVAVEGDLGDAVCAKDVALTIVSRLGFAGGTGHVIEYAGSAIRGLSMEGRMTVSNMSIEAGARAGMIAPDETTIAYLRGRAYAPQAEEWDQAVAIWRSLPGDVGARYDSEMLIDATAIVPMVTWGTRPEQALPITGRVPDPTDAGDPNQKARIEHVLGYMGLNAGTALQDVRIDRVFIGSCTNGRIEDLRAAADVLRGRRSVVPAIVVPGSRQVKRAAEAEGLDRIFLAAGCEWRDSGCSMCVASNGDRVEPGERCASTTNRNFESRQGPRARTHLVGPAMAAAAALTGRLTDVRELAGSA